MALARTFWRTFTLLVVLGALAATPTAADGGLLTLGFALLHDQIEKSEGVDRVGEALEEVHHDALGNATQLTIGGTLFWRKADNWTGFTDGQETWINGPYGLQVRLRTERFQWESSPNGLDDPLQKQDLKQAYRKAVQDAEIAEPHEISRNLVAILDSNDRLTWKGELGNRQVLGVTWTNWPGYNDKAGQSVAAGVDTWVTVVPEVRDCCTACTTPDRTLRLEQLLGLPPESGKQWFVEIWASPHDLFRPSPDPEITDHEAELDFRDSRFVTTSSEHIAWFNDLKSNSYGGNGYPWTRLGYTYDWGNPENVIGLSEFVIRKGANIEVHSVRSAADYCN